MNLSSISSTTPGSRFQFDVAITDRTSTGTRTDSLMAAVLRDGITVSSGYPSGVLSAGPGDYSMGTFTETLNGTDEPELGDRLLPTQRDSVAGRGLSSIVDATYGSDLLTSIFEPHTGPEVGSPNTVTFGYIDDGPYVRREATFSIDAIPAPLRQAYEAARAIFAASANVETDASPFLAAASTPQGR